MEKTSFQVTLYEFVHWFIVKPKFNHSIQILTESYFIEESSIKYVNFPSRQENPSIVPYTTLRDIASSRKQ